MGTIGAVKARTIIENTSFVLAIELMAAAQALDSRKYKSSLVIETIKSEIRKIVAHLKKDRIINDDINNLKKLIDSDILINSTEKFISLK
jgi:histidine ammonia-lyase